MVRAHEDGFLDSEADVRQLLKECNLTLEDALVFPRPVLFSAIAKVLAADVRHTSAAAAVLRSTNLRSQLLSTDRAAVGVSEDVELSPAELCSLLAEASHDNYERARSTFMALEAESEHALRSTGTAAGELAGPGTPLGPAVAARTGSERTARRASDTCKPTQFVCNAKIAQGSDLDCHPR